MAILNEVLPGEMIIEVLQWLPVKSLLKFKSVCKLWLAIISDPDFVKTHTHNMANKNVALLRMVQINIDERPNDLLVPSFEFDFYLLISRSFSVIGSCNGIICLEDCDSFFYLWNPSTKQWKRLPRVFNIGRITGYFNSRYKLAFGFDNISNDYKVVRFVCPVPGDNVLLVVQLYSANTNSWKEIPVNHQLVSRILYDVEFIKSGPVINGVWYMGYREWLVSFNLHDEVFTVDSFPSSMLRHSNIIDFEGSVAVISESVGEGSGISLYTLDNNPGGVSWSKKFSICNEICWAYSYLGGGVLCARKTSDYYIYILYDCRQKGIKSIALSANKIREVLKYTESLVSIKGFEPLACNDLMIFKY